MHNVHTHFIPLSPLSLLPPLSPSSLLPPPSPLSLPHSPVSLLPPLSPSSLPSLPPSRTTSWTPCSSCGCWELWTTRAASLPRGDRWLSSLSTLLSPRCSSPLSIWSAVQRYWYSTYSLHTLYIVLYGGIHTLKVCMNCSRLSGGLAIGERSESTNSLNWASQFTIVFVKHVHWGIGCNREARHAVLLQFWPVVSNVSTPFCVCVCVDHSVDAVGAGHLLPSQGEGGGERPGEREISGPGEWPSHLSSRLPAVEDQPVRTESVHYFCSTGFSLVHCAAK